MFAAYICHNSILVCIVYIYHISILMFTTYVYFLALSWKSFQVIAAIHLLSILLYFCLRSHLPHYFRKSFSFTRKKSFVINTEGQKKKSAHGQRFLLVFRYIRRNLFDFFHTVEECRVGCSVPAAIACGHETGSAAEGRCARR